MALVFVQGDTAPTIRAQILLEEDSSPLDISGATVNFQMRKGDDRRFTVNAPATVVDAPTGQVSYDWGPNDLATPGEYQVQWEVTFSDSRIQTTASSLITVRRQ